MIKKKKDPKLIAQDLFTFIRHRFDPIPKALFTS